MTEEEMNKIIEKQTEKVLEELDEVMKNEPGIDIHRLFRYAYLKGRLDTVDLVRQYVK